MTMLQLELTSAIDRKADHLFAVARGVATRLKAGLETSRSELTSVMQSQFGASDASGIWSMRDAYDAIELAQVLVQMEASAQIFARNSAIPRLERILDEVRLKDDFVDKTGGVKHLTDDAGARQHQRATDRLAIDELEDRVESAAWPSVPRGIVHGKHAKGGTREIRRAGDHRGRV